MSPLLEKYSMVVGQQKLILLPSKVVWVPEHSTLMLADTHFGKAAAFRKAGLPVPAGTTQRMLQQISLLIGQLNLETVIVLGDLVHSNNRASVDFENELTNWRKSFSHVKILLLKGNHDRRNADFYRDLDIELHEDRLLKWHSLELCHDPKDASEENFSLCGHIHPAVQLGSYRLPCFWLRRNQLVLPAFGEFTGLHKVNLNKDESAYAICNESLAVVSYPRL